MNITKIDATKTVAVDSLPVGSCWEYIPVHFPGRLNPIVGMTVCRNGHNFFINLKTGESMRVSKEAQVIPVNAFLNYSEKNT